MKFRGSDNEIMVTAFKSCLRNNCETHLICKNFVKRKVHSLHNLVTFRDITIYVDISFNDLSALMV